MKAVKFPQANVLLGDGQEQYLTLPAHINESEAATCCFELSAAELEKLRKTRRSWRS